TTVWPELTTIRQPIAAMAREAVDLLVSAVRRQNLPPIGERHRVVDFALIRRQSDAAPRRRPRQSGLT
uniref:substrate-binding domain-containing protein n=1 Tax=Sphingomonas sp. TaxID=28214 RepID=UPI0035C87358